MVLTIDDIKTTLANNPVISEPFTPHPSYAAIAMILCKGVQELEFCFIRRAEKEGDRWSGQVAFPGGRANAKDIDAPAVAERETREEINLLVQREQCIGALPRVGIDAAGPSSQTMTLSPFIYYLEQSPLRLTPNEEVAAIFWVPLSHLFDAHNVTKIQWNETGSFFPGIRFAEHVIWGLTLQVLGIFASHFNRQLPALSK